QIKNRGATEKATQAKKEQAAAAEEVKKKILAEEQALVKLNIAYSKASSLADSAFKAASAFVPQLKLDEFNKQQDQLEKSLIDLQEKGKALKIKLVDDADATTQVADITKRIADAEAALGALRTQRRVEANNIELAAFTAMLDTQKSLALTVEQQKTSEILNLRAQLLEGTGAGDAAGESAEVIAEKQKMAQLKALRDADLITQKQYESDLTSIKTAARQASLQKEIEDKQMKAQLLGTSPEALAAQLEVQKQQDMIDLENLRTKLQNEQLTEQEFKIAREQLELTSAQKVQQIQEASLKKRLATQQKNGTFEQRMQTRIELAKVQGFKKTAQLRALTQSQEIQGAGQFFSNLSSLTSSKSKSLFNIGKAAAIAGAVINTAQAATAALAPPPLGAGPILGPAVAASAVVAGALNIAQIKAQKFGGGGSASGGGSAAAPPTAPTPQLNVGGQAHGGIDAIPSSLNNKTFLLSGGERVVQPEANRDLTQYLRDAQTQGANAAPSVINITINGNIDSEDTARSMATMVIEEIRERSERGEPIINRQGVV
ncbi:MAG: hypothetical protein K0U41_06275, partial [Gammaproteobacteria bacterium]|nr:hypothetical protein [Gammaproteobacteria bacterium]